MLIISPQNEYAGVLFVTGLCYMHTVYYESATLSLSLSLYHNTLGIPLTMHTHDVPVMSHLSKCRFPCRPSLTSVLFAVPLVVLGFGFCPPLCLYCVPLPRALHFAGPMSNETTLLIFTEQCEHAWKYDFMMLT